MAASGFIALATATGRYPKPVAPGPMYLRHPQGHPQRRRTMVATRTRRAPTPPHTRARPVDHHRHRRDPHTTRPPRRTGPFDTRHRPSRRRLPGTHHRRLSARHPTTATVGVARSRTFDIDAAGVASRVLQGCSAQSRRGFRHTEPSRLVRPHNTDASRIRASRSPQRSMSAVATSGPLA